MANLRHWFTPRNLLFALVGLLVLGVIFVVGASKLEEQNAFCTACHTAPEQTYYNRAQDVHNKQIVDLASDHFSEQSDFRCIDCHRGDSSLTDRATTLTLGAEDALIFVSGQADPTLEKTTAAEPELLNRACVQCHAKEILEQGFNNHFHNKLIDSYALQVQNGVSGLDSQDFGTVVTCTDCHRAHVHMDNGVARKFLDIEGVVYPACVDCHKQLGHGPLDLAP
jgi:ssDNA-binding Zn-finger/Zn-ribbon topoisomerase 1